MASLLWTIVPVMNIMMQGEHRATQTICGERSFVSASKMTAATKFLQAIFSQVTRLKPKQKFMSWETVILIAFPWIRRIVFCIGGKSDQTPRKIVFKHAA